MAYCPNCNEEFEEGMSACINCGADLVDSPLFGRDEEGLDKLEAVFVGALAEAFEIKSVLEDEGFTAYLQGMEDAQESHHDLAGESGLVKLLVSAESAEAVSETIGSMTRIRTPDKMDTGFRLDEGFEEAMENGGDLEGPQAPRDRSLAPAKGKKQANRARKTGRKTPTGKSRTRGKTKALRSTRGRARPKTRSVSAGAKTPAKKKSGRKTGVAREMAKKK